MPELQSATRERRSAPRIDREWFIEIKNATGPQWRGHSVNVSSTGMRVRVDRALDVRGFMFVTLYPGDNGVCPIWARFSLVRQVVPREYGIRFLDLPLKYVERLQTLTASN